MVFLRAGIRSECFFIMSFSWSAFYFCISSSTWVFFVMLCYFPGWLLCNTRPDVGAPALDCTWAHRRSPRKPAGCWSNKIQQHMVRSLKSDIRIKCNLFELMHVIARKSFWMLSLQRFFLWYSYFLLLWLFQVIGGDSVGAVWAGKPAVQTLLWQTGADIRCEGTAAQTSQTPAPIPSGWALVRLSFITTHSGRNMLLVLVQVNSYISCWLILFKQVIVSCFVNRLCFQSRNSPP